MILGLIVDFRYARSNCIPEKPHGFQSPYVVFSLRSAGAVSYGPQGFVGEAPFTIIQHGSEARTSGAGFHLAFVATRREAVDRFHQAAVEHGGTDDGPPGIRENYDPGYYAAFVRDPDGHRIEAVIHEQAP